MTTEKLLEDIGQALANDAVLTDWCNAQFGKPATIFVGVDESDPPKDEDYPVIAILGIDQVRGIWEKEERWVLSLGIGIINENLPSSGRIRTRPGFVQAEAMRELTELAIYRARIKPAGTTGEAASECLHPLYLGYTAITLKMTADRRGVL